MSVVTGFVLVCPLAEDIAAAEQPPGSIARIIDWLAERGFAAPAEVGERYASGDKHPQFYLYAAGYNRFPTDEFVAFFRSLAWQCPNNVVLCLQPEEGATHVVRPSYG